MKRVRWCRRWERAELGDGQHLQQGLPTRCHSAQQTYSKDNTTGCRTVANRTPCGRVGIAGALNAQRQRPWATNEPHWCTPGLLASRRRAFSTGCRLCGPRGLRPAPPAIRAAVWTSPAGVSAYTKICSFREFRCAAAREECSGSVIPHGHDTFVCVRSGVYHWYNTILAVACSLSPDNVGRPFRPPTMLCTPQTRPRLIPCGADGSQRTSSSWPLAPSPDWARSASAACAVLTSVPPTKGSVLDRRCFAWHDDKGQPQPLGAHTAGRTGESSEERER